MNNGKPDFSNVTGSVASIARHFYGRQDWKRIFDANRDQLDDPDKIFPGQVLRIPARED